MNKTAANTHSHVKEPLIRIVKRDGLKLSKLVLVYVGAILLAMIIGCILLASMGVNPFKFYEKMLTIGVVGNAFPYKCFEGYIKLFTPLLIVSVALSLAFRMKFWNVGGEGQFIVGALVAGWISAIIGESAPSFLVLILMSLGGAIAAGFYGSIASVLKVKFGTNETLMTLMLNYIALYLIMFFGETKADWNILLNEDSARPIFKTFFENAWMPVIKIGSFSLNISLIIAFVITALIFVYLKKTKQGYELSVVGDSISTANYAGMKTGRIIIRTVFISAFLIGLAGAFYVSTAHSLSTSVTNDVGWTGVIVAWLSKLNTLAIVVTSALISILRYGCTQAAAEFASVDSHFADLLQGIILFSVLACDFLTRFKVIINLKRRKSHE
ncbi:MAG: ABC transporter permease [Oscillospiraceae bacterium]|nr:ABC transporter permease [Oscillospiraceae bacterium]